MNIRFISGTVHGVLDYLVAAVLLIAPFVLGFAARSAPALWLSVVAGGSLLVYSLLTDYRNSVAKIIPFKVHLVFDFAAGAVFVVVGLLLAADPPVSAFFLTMGLAVITVVLLTDPGPAPARVALSH